MPHFGFLQREWPEIFTAAAKCETYCLPDPRTSCFYGRRALELAVQWLYRAEPTLKPTYNDDNLSALIHEPAFRNLVGHDLYSKTRIVKDLGNEAVHRAKPLAQADSVTCLRELFHFCYWLARTYAVTPAARPAPQLTFNPDQLAKTSPVPPQTLAQLKKQADEIAARDAELKLRNQTIADFQAKQGSIEEELTRLRAEIAEAKARNAAQPDTHDYSEGETRDAFIDLLLREAGWLLADGRDREFEVTGFPSISGKGYVDYVLWGGDGKPLALVEAKRTKRSVQDGKQQALLYADALERQYGQRPVIFLSNGYEHQIWDDTFYPSRPIQGFYKRDELELLIQRRTARAPLATAAINSKIVERYYQARAIRKITEHFERDRQRRALIVMATGAGKTRTVIALCDLLLRANWVKRVLFLADRVALVNQAAKAFKEHLPSAAPVNLVTERHTEGRVYVSTYPTMVNLIDQTRDGERRFGPGHFDLVVIDEAHRSVYQKYGAIFDYFDSLLVGLTATPRDETARDTYRLFNLEPGVPTDAYELENAVADGFLVPAQSVSVTLKFPREGIAYNDLTEEQRQKWEELDWSADDETPPPNRVEAPAINKWFFNADTVDKGLEHLMKYGQKVAGGDRLGKTIIFAKNDAHAHFIAERFDKHYPHYAGHFARVITYSTDQAQSIIDSFSSPDKNPHIAVSVDMLDTGIDVPEVLNLVFFKPVFSKTKFWQMVGRGTRLSPDLFGPGIDKEFFYIFDFCGNLEYFKENPESTEGSLGMSLNKRLFTLRIECLEEFDKLKPPAAYPELRSAVAEHLRTDVAAMNLDNFIVRPQRRLVEHYAKPESWAVLDLEGRSELVEKIAGLPTENADADVDAKIFDGYLLALQLAVLRGDPTFTKLRKKIETVASLLAEKASIPMVHAQMPLIEQLQTDDYWQNVTPPILEHARKSLRSLVKFIDKQARKPVYTDFEDTLGPVESVDLPVFAAGVDFKKFKAKARSFLKEHETDPVIQKLRTAEPLTMHDLTGIELMLTSANIGTADDVSRASELSHGLGLFLRGLVGLDRAAAKAAFQNFLANRTPTANQIEFLNMIIDHLAEQGFLDPERLYHSPYVDLSPQGVDGLFTTDQVDSIFATLAQIRQTACPT